MGGDGCAGGMMGVFAVAIESDDINFCDGGGWKWCRRLFDLDGDDEVDDGGGGFDEITVSLDFYLFIKWNTIKFKLKKFPG
jgi:hypothetical protein